MDDLHIGSFLDPCWVYDIDPIGIDSIDSMLNSRAKSIMLTRYNLTLTKIWVHLRLISRLKII